MKLFELRREAFAARPIEEVFAFFADPSNLEQLTPPWLRFRVLDCSTGLGPGDIETGSLIRYSLRLHRIPIRWTTHIADWQPPYSFVDEQLRGPYRRWVHTHTFEERGGGTLVRDRIEYAVIGGRLVERLLVRRDLDRIFDYRTARLEARFASGSAGEHASS